MGRDGMVWIPGGTFIMGATLADYPEEGPQLEVTVDGFWVDKTPVTIAEFRQFVQETGYRTVAERPLDPAEYPGILPSLLVPGSLVFTPSAGPVPLDDWRRWWRYVPGARWDKPTGQEATVEHLLDHPVTHVCWEDVDAYAKWAGKAIPTEAEWEYAARAGGRDSLFAWGDELEPGGTVRAHYWRGAFPWLNRHAAGQQRTAPVGSYVANDYGLFDMIGNVWEWTSDFYRSGAARLGEASCCGPTVNPRVGVAEGSYGADEPGGAHVPRRVLKGGSHLCSEEYCQRYRPAARQAQQVESAMSHIGFRCISREE